MPTERRFCVVQSQLWKRHHSIQIGQFRSSPTNEMEAAMLLQGRLDRDRHLIVVVAVTPLDQDDHR
jgi:hypothetical protein